jgi:hypothetical protein
MKLKKDHLFLRITITVITIFIATLAIRSVVLWEWDEPFPLWVFLLGQGIIILISNIWCFRIGKKAGIIEAKEARKKARIIEAKEARKKAIDMLY